MITHATASRHTIATALRQLARRDRVMHRVIKKVGKYRLRQERNLFWLLVVAIANQQLSGKAADTLIVRLRRLYQGRIPSPIEMAKTEARVLRKVGFSRMKVRFLKHLAQAFVRGAIDRRALLRRANGSDEFLITELTKLDGVGRWTAEMALMFGLERLDVFPVDDLGIQKAIKRLYKFKRLPSKRTMLAIAQAWRPYRTVASWYLWQAVDSGGVTAWD
ncbi:MAG: DNA-3-methyladenine glycosylase 2 family protein [Parcubacteria group bacterium]|nr:DNA-3-methyladenine glycosylase 2 family protein [Parcubacteria group bacterium]